MAAKMSIEELHDHLFEVLCTIDDICKRENVRYFLDSGTELGAVRHNDFIPWDDDMDLKVLAEDYPAFKAAMEKYLPPYMRLIEPDAFAPGFYDFIPRIVDDRYLLCSESDERSYYGNNHNHVGADILIFTKVPDSVIARKWMMISTKILYGMGMAHRYRIDYSKYKGIAKIQVKVLTRFGKLLSAKKIIEIFKSNISRYANKESAYRFTPCSRMEYLRFHPEHLFDTTTTFPIRGRHFPVPAGYDAELKQIYGDYMKPPRNMDDYIKHLDV